MTEHKTALLFFQKDIQEAFKLWCDNSQKTIGPFLFQARVQVGLELIYFLVPTIPYHGNTKLVWSEAVTVSNEELSEAMNLLICSRNLRSEFGYWLRVSANINSVEIAAIPHDKKV
jgi:hypothetical protein